MISLTASRIQWCLPSLLCLALAGCAVGPNFTRPSPPPVTGYTPEPLTNTTQTPNVPGGVGQKFIGGLDIPGEWWLLFHSKPLNALIERSLTNSPDLKAAQAALKVAHENVLAHRGVYFPSLAGSFAATRHKTPALLSPFQTTSTAEGAVYYSFFTPQVTVAYTPDVFGLNRRTGESLQAQEQAVRFTGLATYLTLSANVVGAAIQEASLRAQIAATQQLIDINSNLLEIVHFQLQKGAASQVEVAAQEALLAQARTGLPPLRKQLAQQRDLLAALAGGYPSQAFAEKFELSSLQLPADLPVSLPAQLIEHRPDVRQAEANYHAASAQIGIAIANRLPALNLTADVGSMAELASQMFAPGTGFWDLGATLTKPLFQGGTLLHQQRAAQAAYVQAAEQYRSAVLTAFQNVADTLNALEADADALKAAAAAKDAADATLELVQDQLKFGLVSYSIVLTAEQSHQQAAISLVQAEANRFADTAALFQALGGGWWNRPEFAKDTNER